MRECESECDNRIKSKNCVCVRERVRKRKNKSKHTSRKKKQVKCISLIQCSREWQCIERWYWARSSETRIDYVSNVPGSKWKRDEEKQISCLCARGEGEESVVNHKTSLHVYVCVCVCVWEGDGCYFLIYIWSAWKSHWFSHLSLSFSLQIANPLFSLSCSHRNCVNMNAFGWHFAQHSLFTSIHFSLSMS